MKRSAWFNAATCCVHLDPMTCVALTRSHHSLSQLLVRHQPSHDSGAGRLRRAEWLQPAAESPVQPGTELREITRSALGFAPRGRCSQRKSCRERIQPPSKASIALLALELHAQRCLGISLASQDGSKAESLSPSYCRGRRRAIRNPPWTRRRDGSCNLYS